MASSLHSSLLLLVPLHRSIFVSYSKSRIPLLLPSPCTSPRDLDLVDSSAASTNPPANAATPLPLSVREQAYEVLEVLPDSTTSPRSINRCPPFPPRPRTCPQLRLPPCHCLADHILLFGHHCRGVSAFLRSLLSRLVVTVMPFELEVLEAALISRIQLLEHRLVSIEPRVAQLLELLPNRLTVDVLEELRLSKQTLV
ncbi:hypothetical protein KSP40_PGU017333 [Platanthera guangdongensis]|uniref:Uncharacterized protein n=1 Tax=Platanthera guangdongensis TaxID=2320717 RepID=A0ABR2MCZ0_9ASPA